ncbi:DUF6193 family natural product biosynthesis protein [Streptomyces sp. HSW2009]|uniref:DUF6193 family natural product biosynthesis protein n=1 Tax=Streptomyces sp. HSW2009 TaxID=3142890 RepID=UPI0032EE29FF
MTSNSPRPANPADPDLYPDLAAAGSLAEALESAAAEQGLDLGAIQRNDSEPLRSAGIISSDAGRAPCWVFVGVKSRWFSINGWSQGIELLTGTTSELAEVARAAAGWRSGAGLGEIQRVAPFIKVSELVAAHEVGPAEAVSVQWGLLCDDLRRQAGRLEPARQTLALAEVAAEEPKLRQLYPFTSHWSLHFSTCTGFPYAWDVPFVDLLKDGRYRVCGPARGTVVGEADTAEQAIALVLAGLPADCGPAVAGTAGDVAQPDPN